MNSTFRARWLASSEVISQVLFTKQPKKNKMALLVYIVTNKVTLWSVSYSACMVYTKTIIHLSVVESAGYLPPLRWITVNSKCTFWSVGSCLMHSWIRQFTLTVPLYAQFNRLLWQLDGETRQCAKCILQWTRNPSSVRTIIRYVPKSLHLDPLVWEQMLLAYTWSGVRF